MPNITLHIGYPKTATTYLQKKVLPRVGALGRHTSIPQARELDRPLGRIALLEKPSFWESTRGQNFFRELISLFYSREGRKSQDAALLMAVVGQFVASSWAAHGCGGVLQALSRAGFPFPEGCTAA